MKKFVNRNHEIDYLNREFESNRSSLVVLYGRRRVGKTSLIREFIKDKSALYYLATEESLDLNMTYFKNLVAEFLDNDLLRDASFTRWEPIFESLVKSDEKTVIVIDEFQYLGKSDASFPSIFQRIWDTVLADGNVMVILCGSLISLMMEQVLSYSSPLYGRRTGQIKLGQIKFEHYSKFFPETGIQSLIELYSVTGGVPKYVEMFTSTNEIYYDIEANILNQSNILYEEPYFLLSKEVSEIGSYFSVLRAIAAGNHKLGKISSFLEVRQSNLTRYLKVLIDLDILEREVPITEKNPDKSKRGLYIFKDNYLKFWFRFIYPNRSRIEDGHVKDVLSKIQKSFVNNHVAFVYEDISRENVTSLEKLKRQDISLGKIGRWWSKNEEIDIVGLDEDKKVIVFGECKYWEGLAGMSVLNELQRKSTLVDWNNDRRKEVFVIFSLNGFTDDIQEYANSQDNVILVEGLKE